MWLNIEDEKVPIHLIKEQRTCTQSEDKMQI
jgi:hypothetical protein